MLRSYLTVTLRNLSRHRLHSAISVFSLAVGMAAGIIALVFIQHEVSFDRFHDDVGRLFRVLRQRGEGDRLNVRWTTSGALARALESDFPQIEAASRSRMYHVNVRVDEQTFTLRQTHVDEQFLTLFEFPFVRGSRADLSEPYSIAITRSTAKLCFGERDPIGQLVTIEERYYGGDYTVTGIIEDPPPNSSLQFDLIHQTEPRDAEGLRDWQDWRPRVQQAQIQTFVRLSAGVAAADMERSLSAAIGRYMGAEAQQNISYRLQPLLRQHLYSHQDWLAMATSTRSSPSALWPASSCSSPASTSPTWLRRVPCRAPARSACARWSAPGAFRWLYSFSASPRCSPPSP